MTDLPPTLTATNWSAVPIGKFVAQLIARQPTPGGGAACAVSAAIGTATIAMAAGYTSGPKYAAVEAEAQTLYAALDAGARQLVLLATEDEAAYGAVNAVLALPKEPEEARKLRWERLKKARREAAQVPVRLMEMCLAMLELARKLKPICNQSILSDLGAGSEMVAGALQAAAAQVRANLEGLKGADKITAQVTALEAAFPPVLADIRAVAPPAPATGDSSA